MAQQENAADGQRGKKPEDQGQGGRSRGQRGGRRRRSSDSARKDAGGNAGGSSTTGNGGGAKADKPQGQQGQQGEGRRNNNRGGGGGRGGNQQGQSNRSQRGRSSGNQQQRQSRKRSGSPQERIPELSDWCFDHRGYTVWMAQSQVPLASSKERLVRIYIVDIHAGEHAVDVKAWPVIEDFLNLDSHAPTFDKGRKQLAEAFAREAERRKLPSADQYNAQVPAPESKYAPVSENALAGAMELERDHPQEDIDLLNEGRKGAPLS